MSARWRGFFVALACGPGSLAGVTVTFSTVRESTMSLSPRPGRLLNRLSLVLGCLVGLISSGEH